MTAMSSFHLAHLNVATLRYPIDAPEVAEFVDNLDPVNKLADESPGFVWRLHGDIMDPDDFRPYDDENVVVTLSVWESADALFDYVYRGGHMDFLRRRLEWFERDKQHGAVLWWIPAGHQPTLREAVERLELLRADGPTQRAFTFRQRFEPGLE
jgi:hypothetical protein